MRDIGSSFIFGERTEVEIEGDTLVEGRKNRALEAWGKMGLSDKDKDGGVRGIDVEIGNNLKFEEVFIFEEMSFIEDDDGDFFIIRDKVSDRVLNGLKEDGFFPEREARESKTELAVEIHRSNGRERDIDGFKEIRVEGIEEASDMERFTCSGITCNKHKASVLFDKIEAAIEFMNGGGAKNIFSFNPF